ncbi:MAG: acyl-[acyl-carrier-protein] thioesterase [Sphingobacterium sp.]|uniref:acyl-[acyl-carrier-protein] thioesterase n=1 Tax=Sphingobacterium sp. JB170 TaxID=1434842 RepID=UPI00097E8B46|nr:acyl-ACP thioesterase domain-containing protein [Sphingobacterium sp. JB170]SJN49574.1 Acyl-ACP thioesterase [Sphingobacterium sp. JB170]
MESPIFSSRYKINFTQCYANGLLKYSELSNLLQLTASEHAEELGFGYREMAKKSQSWVLSRVRIEIVKLPQFLEEITIKTWIQDFKGNRSVRNFEVLKGDVIIAAASSFWAVFNTKERKSEHLAIEVDPAIILPEKTATKNPFKRIEMAKEFDMRSDYVPKLSDLDIVNHVNNVKYTDWCLDCLPPEVVLQQPFKFIDINYLKELKLGQSVTVHTLMRAGRVNFVIKREDKSIFTMELS